MQIKLGLIVIFVTYIVTFCSAQNIEPIDSTSTPEYYKKYIKPYETSSFQDTKMYLKSIFLKNHKPKRNVTDSSMYNSTNSINEQESSKLNNYKRIYGYVESLKFNFNFSSIPNTVSDILILDKNLSPSSYNSLLNQRNKMAIEFFLTPAFYFNSLNLGLSYQFKGKWEYMVLFGARYLSTVFYNLNANVNVNYNLENTLRYIPIWFKFSDLRTNYSLDGGLANQIVKIAVGTGFGSKKVYYKKLNLRLEIGIGLAAQFNNANGDMLPYKFDYSAYRYEKLRSELKVKLTFNRVL